MMAAIGSCHDPKRVHQFTMHVHIIDRWAAHPPTGEPVDLAEADRDDAKSFTASPTFARPIRDLRRMTGGDAPPTGVAGIQPAAPCRRVAPERRMEAVGADQKSGIDALAVHERHVHRCRSARTRRPAARGDDIRSDRVEQNRNEGGPGAAPRATHPCVGTPMSGRLRVPGPPRESRIAARATTIPADVTA